MCEIVETEPPQNKYKNIYYRSVPNKSVRVFCLGRLEKWTQNSVNWIRGRRITSKMLMSPDSSFSPPSSVGAAIHHHQQHHHRQPSVLVVAPSSSSSATSSTVLVNNNIHHNSSPSSSSSQQPTIALNLQKYDRDNNKPPTTIATTAVIRVQVPECTQSQYIPPSSNNQGNIVFNSPPPSSSSGQHAKSNVIVVNKSLSPPQRPQHTISSGMGSSNQMPRPSSPEYVKSYPVMDTTVASTLKGEPELNIG